jgi:hypothetical protein
MELGSCRLVVKLQMGAQVVWETGMKKVTIGAVITLMVWCHVTYAQDNTAQPPTTPSAVNALKKHEAAMTKARDAYWNAMIAADQQLVIDLEIVLKTARSSPEEKQRLESAHQQAVLELEKSKESSKDGRALADQSGAGVNMKDLLDNIPAEYRPPEKAAWDSAPRMKAEQWYDANVEGRQVFGTAIIEDIEVKIQNQLPRTKVILSVPGKTTLALTCEPGEKSETAAKQLKIGNRIRYTGTVTRVGFGFVDSSPRIYFLSMDVTPTEISKN